MPFVVVINVRSSDNLSQTTQEIDRFNNVKLHLQYDSVASTFEFEVSFDANNERDRELFEVSHMHECSIYYVHENVGNFKDINYQSFFSKRELLFTGTMLSLGFSESAKPTTTNVAGYSRPGALEDCDIPTDKYPLESNGKTFRQIVSNILSPSPGKKSFNFKMVIDKLGSKDGNAAFIEEQSADEVDEKSTASKSTNIKSYLTTLASQKNIVLSHTPQGDLLITAANIKGTPILDITGIGTNGVTDIQLTYNGQALHSEITVIGQAPEDGGNAAEFTMKNPLCPIVYRPKVVTLTSGNDISISKAARNEVGAEIKSIRLVISMNKIALNNKVITPNNIITITNPNVYLYAKTRWIIESVDPEMDASGEKIVLNCVLPCVYGGVIINPFII